MYTNGYVEACEHASKQYTEGLAFAVQLHLPELFRRAQEGGPPTKSGLVYWRGQEEDKARLEKEAAGEAWLKFLSFHVISYFWYGQDMVHFSKRDGHHHSLPGA